jgi:hypothetical protein
MAYRPEDQDEEYEKYNNLSKQVLKVAKDHWSLFAFLSHYRNERLGEVEDEFEHGYPEVDEQREELQQKTQYEIEQMLYLSHDYLSVNGPARCADEGRLSEGTVSAEERVFLSICSRRATTLFIFQYQVTISRAKRKSRADRHRQKITFSRGIWGQYMHFILSSNS